jgi:DNA-binding transcriptional LysR family regulator
MDLEQLRAFAKIVRLGSVTKAAISLGLPKSTISRRLSELESHLGTRLVQRTTRRLSVTDAGYRLFQQAEPHILELEAAARSMTTESGELAGTLRITTPANLAELNLVPIIHDFMEQHPQVKIVALATNRKVDLVAEGVDVALRAGTLQSSTLVARRLVAGEFRLFASEEYLERKGTPKTVHELLTHDCLAFSEDQPLQKWRLHSVVQPEKVQEITVQARFASTEYAALRRACALGMGIALMPNEVRDKGTAHNLKRVLPQWRGQESVLHVVYPASRHVSPTVRAFVDHVVKVVPKLFA